MRPLSPGRPLSWGAVSPKPWTPAVPVILLTGFLGAGKTSVLNHLLRDPDSRVGVVVNDFGDLNVDAGLVAGQVDEPVSIAGGCVCCLSDTSALEGALVSLADPRLELDAIIVEASGIAEPLTLARMVSQWGRHRFHLAGVVDVVDVLMHGETVDTDSLPPVRYAATTLVVVNKLDALPVDRRAAAVDAIRRRVHQRNPRVLVTGTVFGRLDPSLLLDPGDRRRTPRAPAVPAGSTAAEAAEGEASRAGADDGEAIYDGVAESGPSSGEVVQGELPVWDLLRQEYSEREAAALAALDLEGVPHRHALSVTVRRPGCVDADGVMDFVEDLPGGVYRVKGTIAVADGNRTRRFVVQVVGPSVYVSAVPRRAAAQDDGVESALVVIGEDFDEAAVRARLEAAMTGTSAGDGLRRLQRYVHLHS